MIFFLNIKNNSHMNVFPMFFFYWNIKNNSRTNHLQCFFLWLYDSMFFLLTLWLYVFFCDSLYMGAIKVLVFHIRNAAENAFHASDYSPRTIDPKNYRPHQGESVQNWHVPTDHCNLGRVICICCVNIIYNDIIIFKCYIYNI